MADKTVTFSPPALIDTITISPSIQTLMTVEVTASGLSADGSMRDTGVVTFQIDRGNPTMANILAFCMNQWRIGKGY